MVRYLKIVAVSYKSRGVKIHDAWLDAAKDFDLNLLRVGQTYPLEISQNLEGKWIVEGIANAGNV